MDRRANVKWMYAIGVALIITNAASGVIGLNSDSSPLTTQKTDDPESNYEYCSTMREDCECTCNIVKTRNYEYERVYPITKGKYGTVRLKFKVKGDRDANLLFSKEAYTRDGDAAHEIVLSATPPGDSATAGDNTTSGNDTTSGNQASWLLNAKNNVAGRVETFSEEARVSPNEWREYWVQIKHNRVEVGRNGKRPFLVSTNSSKNIPIRYYSVAGHSNATLLWGLPCMEEKDFHW